MGARKIIVLALIAAVAAAALLASTAAQAAKRSVIHDAVRETKALRHNGRVDIVKAIAAHHGKLVQHTVVVRAKIKPSRHRERPLLGINTRGGPTSDPEYLVYGGAIFKTPKKGKPKRIASAQLTSHGRRWRYRFDPRDFPHGGLHRYGWAAFTRTKKALDVVPANSYAGWHA